VPCIYAAAAPCGAIRNPLPSLFWSFEHSHFEFVSDSCPEQRRRIVLRISNFFFSAVSATFLSLGDAVNQKHGLCRNIHSRNAADPQKSRIKKSGFRQLQEAAISGPRVRSRPFATKLASQAHGRWSAPRCLKPSAQICVNLRKSVKSVVKIHLTPNCQSCIIYI